MHKDNTKNTARNDNPPQTPFPQSRAGRATSAARSSAEISTYYEDLARAIRGELKIDARDALRRHAEAYEIYLRDEAARMDRTGRRAA